jgi:hypothetical protein
MHLPGFSAELALGKAGEVYKGASIALVAQSQLIVPQMCRCVASDPFGCVVWFCPGPVHF